MTDSAVWTGYQEITISEKSIVSIKITYGNVFFFPWYQKFLCLER